MIDGLIDNLIYWFMNVGDEGGMLVIVWDN